MIDNPYDLGAAPQREGFRGMSRGSLGAQRVRETFNTTGNPLVDKFKRYTADLIDICNAENDKHDDPEKGRLYSLAMTAYEEAAMWAVKAATFEEPKR